MIIVEGIVIEFIGRGIESDGVGALLAMAKCVIDQFLLTRVIQPPETTFARLVVFPC